MGDDEILLGIVTGLVVGLAVLAIILFLSLASYKKEAFDRGFMVECLGKSGYYWECE